MFNKKRYIETFVRVGEDMGKTAKKFGDVGRKPDSSLEELRIKRQAYGVCQSEYEKQYEAIKALDAPPGAKVEHDRFVQILRQFVKAVEKEQEAINLDDGTIDFNLKNIAAAANKDAVSKAEVAVNNIIKKISRL